MKIKSVSDIIYERINRVVHETLDELTPSAEILWRPRLAPLIDELGEKLSRLEQTIKAEKKDKDTPRSPVYTGIGE